MVEPERTHSQQLRLVPRAAVDRRWLDTTEVGDVVIVSATGGIGAGRATELWAEVEGALELAMGRLVVVDLSRAHSFDERSIRALHCLARACERRQRDICLVMRSGSSLAQYAHSRGLGARLPTYASVCELVDFTTSASPITSLARSSTPRWNRVPLEAFVSVCRRPTN